MTVPVTAAGGNRARRARRVFAALGLALLVSVWGDAASATPVDPTPTVTETVTSTVTATATATVTTVPVTATRTLDPAQFWPVLFLLGVLVMLSVATYVVAASRPKSAHR